MNRNKFNDMTNEGFDIKRAIPLTLREAKNAYKFRERRDGSSIEVCIYARAKREKCSDTDFQNMDVTNLTGSDLLRLGRSKTGTLKIPDNTGGNETHENVVCYGLTRLDVIGEGQANLIINIAFDSAKIATKRHWKGSFCILNPSVCTALRADSDSGFRNVYFGPFRLH